MSSFLTIFILQKEVSQLTKGSFASFQFKQEIEGAINQLGFVTPTEIQRRAIPTIMKGRSVFGQSHTGSGKTHTYLLPLMNQINESDRHVQYVITAPTRELAVQLYDEVRKIIAYANKEGTWIARLLVGGEDRRKMAERLRKPPHIIIGTPGRILDLVKEGSLSIYQASALVIDEADLMLDLGFIEEVDQLLVRSREDVQLIAFSATVPPRLEQFLNKYLQDPVYIKIEGHISPPTIHHRLISKRHRDEAEIIAQLAKLFKPYIALVFTNGQDEADSLLAKLQAKELNVGILHGGLTPRQRKRTVKQLDELRYQYMVVTDLASRGIDIEGVSHVINAQMPKEEDFYVHRVGRTARAGMQGDAISFYTEEDIPLIEKLEKQGVSFTYCDIRDGKWMKAERWDARKKRKRSTTTIDQEAWKRVRRPKKVKPGYKKKMKRQQEEIKKQLQKKSSKRKRKPFK